MLENILEKINKNLEEISNTLKERNDLLKQMTKTQKSENMKESTVIEQPITTHQIAVSIPPTPEATTRNTAGGLNIQPSIPINAPINNITPTTIPTTAPSYTQEQIAVAMSNAVAIGKRDLVEQILASFSVQALTQIDPVNYNRIAAMLTEAGVKV